MKKSLKVNFVRTIFLIILFFCGISQLTLAQTSFKKKTDWTVSEVKEWVDKNKNHSVWRGWILYQGSDTSKHHFISRINDGWVFFKIDRTDLRIADEQKVRTTSTAPLGYYYVDVTKDFLKVKDYRR